MTANPTRSTFAIISEAHTLLFALEESEGVITPEIELLLDTWEDSIEERTEKLDALRWVIKESKARETLYRDEARSMAEKGRAMAGLQDRLKGRVTDLLFAMEAADGTAKVKTAKASYWLAETKSIQGPEADTDWPEAFQKTSVKADRAGALKALKAGEQFDGLSIVSKRTARMR